MSVEVQIARLKNKARAAYRGYHGRTAHLDCGHFMAQHITGARSHAVEFNKVMDELVKLDPTSPPYRIPVV